MKETVSPSHYQPRSRPMPPLPKPTRAGWLNLLVFALILFSLCGEGFFNIYINGGVDYSDNLPRFANTNPGDLGANPLGVNAFLQLETADISQIDKSLDLIKAGGFGFVRQEFPWQDIEPAPGRYTDQNNLDTWKVFDYIVEGAKARGLQVIARVDKAPSWTRQQVYDSIDTRDCGERAGPPQNYNQYGDFVAQLATRYKGKLKYFQIWNEPNLHAEWNCQKVNAAEYTQLLKVAYTRLKAVDPTNVVLAAALSPTDVLDPKSNDLNELDYLDKMYKAGAKNYFDVMSAQIYGLGYSPDYRYVEPDPHYKDFRRTNFSRTWLLHDVMVQNGDDQKSVWASEYGWISIPKSSPALPKYNQLPLWGDSVDEQTQAKYLIDGLNRARQEWPWLGVVNVWFFRADPTLYQNRDEVTPYYFSIVNEDFSPRPAFIALQSYARDAYKIAATGFHPANDPSISYRGTWEKSQAKTDSSLVFSFQGDKAEIDLKPLMAGQMNIKLDGVTTGLYKYTNNLEEKRVIIAENLPDGPAHYHQIELTFKSNAASNDPIAQVKGFYVLRVNYFGWLYTLLYVVFGIGLLVSGAFLFPRIFRNAKTVGTFAFVGAERVGIRSGRSTKKQAFIAREWIRANPQKAKNFGLQILMGFTLALFYFPSVTWLSIIGLILFVPLAWLFPITSLGLAIATAPLQYHPHNFRTAENPFEFGLNEVIIVVTALVWVGHIARNIVVKRRHVITPEEYAEFGEAKTETFSRYRQRISLKNNWFVRFVKRQGPFALPLTLFFILACASLLVPEPSHLKEALREFRLVIVEPLLLYLLVLYYVKRSKEAFVLLDFLVVSAVLISFLGVYQFIFTKGDATIQAEGVSRVVGVYPHPDNLGLFLGRVITIVVAVVFFYEGGWNYKRRKLYLLALLPLLIVLILSFSRGAWLAVAVSILVMTIAAGSRRGLLVYGGAAILGLIALPFIKLERVTSLFSFVTGSNVTRVNVWQSSLQMIHDNFITGIGLDQFLYKYSIEYVKPQAWLERFISHPHNLIFDYWLRLGIIGPVVLIWLLFCFYWVALTLRRRIGKVDQQATKLFSKQRVLALALFGSMTDFAVHGLVDNSYFLIDLAIIFCLEFSLLEILRREIVAEANKEHLE